MSWKVKSESDTDRVLAEVDSAGRETGQYHYEFTHPRGLKSDQSIQPRRVVYSPNYRAPSGRPGWPWLVRISYAAGALVYTAGVVELTRWLR
jgi:hypothetical protein